MAQGTPELIAELAKIDPLQPYGTALFDALAKATVSVAVEAVCLKLKEDIVLDGSKIYWVEVYLVQRAVDDTAYPGEWHCPGSVLRPGENFADVLARLEQKEFHAKLASARFIDLVNHPTEARGHFLSLVFLCDLPEADGQRGKWFAVNNLPHPTVTSHSYRIIPAALGAFVAENTKICS